MAPEVLVMSLDRWNKLSADDQNIVQTSARTSVQYMRTLWDERVSGARSRLIADGVKVNEVADLSAFSAKMRPIWERFVVSDEQKSLVKQIEEMDVAE